MISLYKKEIADSVTNGKKQRKDQTMVDDILSMSVILCGKEGAINQMYIFYWIRSNQSLIRIFTTTKKKGKCGPIPNDAEKNCVECLRRIWVNLNLEKKYTILVILCQHNRFWFYLNTE